MIDTVFVYGTLKQGEVNNQLLSDCEYLYDGMVKGAALLDLGGFPGMVLARCFDGDWAKGEVYKSPTINTTLRKLDVLENEGTLYKRVILPLQPIVEPMVDGEGMLDCYVYLYMPAYSYPLLGGGWWSSHGFDGGMV